jgi:hypothetical protein
MLEIRKGTSDSLPFMPAPCPTSKVPPRAFHRHGEVGKYNFPPTYLHCGSTRLTSLLRYQKQQQEFRHS